MAVLHIPSENRSIQGFEPIRDYLAARGVWHAQWQASEPLSPNAEADEVLAAYRHVLEPYMQQHGYQVADVISIHSQTPNIEALRAKFLSEHTHTEDEVRFFVDGEGLFWFNLGEDEPVVGVLCQAGDLLSVPAGIKHWFDFGPQPHVKVIRIFIDAAGWVPYYTDSRLEQEFNGKVAIGQAQ